MAASGSEGETATQGHAASPPVALKEASERKPTAQAAFDRRRAKEEAKEKEAQDLVLDQQRREAQAKEEKEREARRQRDEIAFKKAAANRPLHTRSCAFYCAAL